MLQKLGLLCVLSILLIFVGCGAKDETVSETAGSPETTGSPETMAASSSAATTTPVPEKITVQHILIGFKGTMQGKDVTRSEDEARQLAQEVFEMAKTSGDLCALVKEYTDDAYPGIYAIVMNEKDANPDMQIYLRTSMVPSFGDVAFSLEAGEIGLAQYYPKKSKFGWHIIKRLR